MGTLGKVPCCAPEFGSSPGGGGGGGAGGGGVYSWYYIDPSQPNDATVHRFQTIPEALVDALASAITAPLLWLAEGQIHYWDGSDADPSFLGIFIQGAQQSPYAYFNGGPPQLFLNDATATVPFALPSGGTELVFQNLYVWASNIGAGTGCLATIEDGWGVKFIDCSFEAPLLAWELTNCTLIFTSCRVTVDSTLPTGATSWIKIADAAFVSLQFLKGTVLDVTRDADPVIEVGSVGAFSVLFLTMTDVNIRWEALAASNFILAPDGDCSFIGSNVFFQAVMLDDASSYTMVETSTSTNGWDFQDLRILAFTPNAAAASTLNLSPPGTITAEEWCSITFLHGGFYRPPSQADSAMIYGTQAGPSNEFDGSGPSYTGGYEQPGITFARNLGTDRHQWEGPEGRVLFYGNTTNAGRTANLTQLLDPALTLYQLNTGHPTSEWEFDISVRVRAFKSSATDFAIILINATVRMTSANVITIIQQTSSSALGAVPPATFLATLTIVAANGLRIAVDQGAAGGNVSWAATMTCVGRAVT